VTFFKAFKSGVGKTLGVCAGVIIIFVIIGLLAGSSGKFGVKDCGSDPICFTDALKDCSLAKATASSLQAERIYEIFGKEGGSCKVRYTIEVFTGQTVVEECLATTGQTLKKGNTTTLTYIELTNCGNRVVK